MKKPILSLFSVFAFSILSPALGTTSSQGLTSKASAIEALKKEIKKQQKQVLALEWAIQLPEERINQARQLIIQAKNSQGAANKNIHNDISWETTYTKKEEQASTKANKKTDAQEVESFAYKQGLQEQDLKVYNTEIQEADRTIAKIQEADRTIAKNKNAKAPLIQSLDKSQKKLKNLKIQLQDLELFSK